MSRLEKIPVPCIATFLSFMTLSNVYGGLGFVWFRYLVMAIATIFMICYTIKIAMFPKTCMQEYDLTIPASLYGAYSMCWMVLGSFYYEIGLPFGRIIWFIAVAIHCIHIIVFTVRHAFGKVIIPKNFIAMMPSWFVTYNGWMVACVTGGKMGAGPILKFITIYGCIIYVVLVPFMIWRLLNVEIKAATSFMYICVLASLCFILFKLPDFFSFDFYPGFAGLTFPMAIGVVASQKMAGYLTEKGSEALGNACTQLAGLQIFVTSMLVGYVMLMFLRMFLKKEKRG